MWWKFRDPWDVSFAKGVTAALEAQGEAAHDAWCIGFFIDNEINWGGETDLAKWTLQSPADQPAKAALADWLWGKYGTVAALNAARRIAARSARASGRRVTRPTARRR